MQTKYNTKVPPGGIKAQFAPLMHLNFLHAKFVSRPLGVRAVTGYHCALKCCCFIHFLDYNVLAPLLLLLLLFYKIVLCDTFYFHFSPSEKIMLCCINHLLVSHFHVI